MGMSASARSADGRTQHKADLQMGSSRPAPPLSLLKPSTVAAYTAAGFWGDETIYHLAARHARATPQAFARDGKCGVMFDGACDPVRRPRRVPPFAIDDIVTDADPRGLDPASRFLTAAAALALRDAGIKVRGPLRDRAGLLVDLLGDCPWDEVFMRLALLGYVF